jgi:hypothetical protein
LSDKETLCCPGKKRCEVYTYWPKPSEDKGKVLGETYDMILRFIEEKIKLKGFRYKINGITSKLSAF